MTRFLNKTLFTILVNGCESLETGRISRYYMECVWNFVFLFTNNDTVFLALCFRSKSQLWFLPSLNPFCSHKATLSLGLHCFLYPHVLSRPTAPRVFTTRKVNNGASTHQSRTLPLAFTVPDVSSHTEHLVKTVLKF